MSEASKRIKEIIAAAAQKAGDPEKDLTGPQVKKLQQNTMNKVKKTYKQFVTEAIGRHVSAMTTDLGGVKGDVSRKKTQQKLQTAIKKDEEESRAKDKETQSRLARERMTKGIYGNWKGHGWGWMKTDRETRRKTFTPGKYDS